MRDDAGARFLALLTALSLMFLLFPGKANASGLSCYVNDEENRVYACGKKESRRIALTFDDGPHPKYTEEILGVLDRYGVKATFFVIGKNVEAYPGIFEKTAARGHEIGCHTYSHRRLSGMDEETLLLEIAKTSDVLARRGVRARLFRPPEGFCRAPVIAAAHSAGMDIILWNVDTEDWKCPGKAAILSAVPERLQGGEIILMHDYVSGRSSTASALEELLQRILRQGYEPVTVSQLLYGD